MGIYPTVANEMIKIEIAVIAKLRIKQFMAVKIPSRSETLSEFYPPQQIYPQSLQRLKNLGAKAKSIAIAINFDNFDND